ncbi:MAG: hypothetical protein DI551_03310 [Micavibrio aeruginosavorus]|uniref:Uncharacterized protein n=1 Tax=Micavibrio aeruginosavorus TaxID=349221 RepID=A0A2W5N2U3_9BACT|nr:MAG: hypothetical protein DI551_03310 [Micavibrio aeruginosavorus]
MLTSRFTEQGPIVVAITPSKDRHAFLERQLDAFWKPYQEFRKTHPEAPALKWIIVDETSEASELFSSMDNPDITYINMRDRKHLGSVPHQFRDTCRECLFSETDIKKRVEHLATNSLSDRFIVAHDLWIPSIGEMRNVGILIAHKLYGHADKNAVIMAKDDDDFSSPEIVPAVYDLLQDGHDFVKLGNMFVHDAIGGNWYHYAYSKQDQETHVLENGHKSVIPRYVVWDDKAQTKENKYKHAGIYGLAFNYRMDAAVEIGEKFRSEFGKFGPFRPLSRREDVQFFMDMVEQRGEHRIRIADNPMHSLVRIVHNNTTRTMHNGAVDLNDVPLATQNLVGILCDREPTTRDRLVGQTFSLPVLDLSKAF